MKMLVVFQVIRNDYENILMNLVHIFENGNPTEKDIRELEGRLCKMIGARKIVIVNLIPLGW